MKKYFLLSGFFILFALSASALTLPAIRNAFNEYDMPLIDGITYFMNMSKNFAEIAILFGKVLGVVCIVWNAFRLWMGTEQVKKACVDIITKFMIFTVLMFTYPQIVDGVITISMNIGKDMGGSNAVVASFTDLYKSLEKSLQASSDTLLTLLNDNKGLKTISRKTLEVLYGVTDNQETVDNLLRNHGITVWEDNGSPRGSNPLYSAGGVNDSYLAHRMQAKEFDKQIAAQVVKAYEDGGGKDAAITMKALQEVFQIELTEHGNLPSIEQSLYDPFMAGVGDSALLSPGKIVKTASIIASIISRKSSIDYTAALKEEEEDMGFGERLVHNTVQSLLHFILTMLMTLGILASAIFFDIQYTMCLFEYYLVTSIGVIFIPFCLWDGTKSFAAKLVTLFSAYFIKMMVMTLCVFWVFAAYIRMGSFIITRDITVYSFAYFLFTCLLGFAVTQNGPQIAVTLLNGSPQLSMGEFMRAAGTIGAGAAMAGKAAATAGKGAQSMGRSAATVGAAALAGRDVAKETGSAGEGWKAFGTTLGNAVKSGARNTAAKLLTGQETQEHKQGSLVGSSTGADGKSLTFGEARKRAAQQYIDKKNNSEAAAREDKTPAPDTPKAGRSQQPLIVGGGSGGQSRALTKKNRKGVKKYG
jgi:type IV secretion system protein TrbL